MDVRRQIRKKLFEKATEKALKLQGIKPEKKKRFTKKATTSNIFLRTITRKIEKSLRNQIKEPSKTNLLYYQIRLHLKNTRNLSRSQDLILAVNHPHLRVFYDDRYKCILCSLDFIQLTINEPNLDTILDLLRKDEALVEGRLGKKKYLLLELTNPIKPVIEKMLPIREEKIGKLFLKTLPKSPFNPEPIVRK